MMMDSPGLRIVSEADNQITNTKGQLLTLC